MAFALATSAAAPPQFPLLHSLLDPGTNAQAGGAGPGHGGSVAIDGTIAAVGARNDDLVGTDAGVVKVYDLTTGALLHLLTKPNPGVSDYFGAAVAISGTRVVAGAENDDTGVENAGTAYVFDLASANPTVPTFTLTNPSPVWNENFGRVVAISGTRVVLGVPKDNTGGSFSGIAYVYDLASVTPTLPVTILTNPSPVSGDEFGRAVAISGTRVVVGVPWNDAGASGAGIAYVYDLTNAAQIVPVATLTNPSPQGADTFGQAVAISGARVVVGAWYDNTGGTDAGSAYVYDLAGPTPTASITLTNPSPEGLDNFGISVAISGTTVLVGASGDNTGADNAGIAYVYDLTGPNPAVPDLILTNVSPTASDNFGTSVAISGAQVVVGASLDDTFGPEAGSVYAYALTGTTPTIPTAILGHRSPVSFDRFGHAVALSGTRLLVGAPYDDTGAVDAGKAYVYVLASQTPLRPVLTLTNPQPAAGDCFGYAVSMAGTRLVIGTPCDDRGGTDAGIAYVFDLSSTLPTSPVLTLTNPQPASFDQFGNAVAISELLVVIGALTDDTLAGDTFTGDSGSAYAYDLSGAAPAIPVVTLTNPSPASFDYFGCAVAISGSRAVVGAYEDDSGLASAGSAYVFDITGATPTIPVYTLTNPSPAIGDHFGFAVDISGSRVAVGAPRKDVGATDVGRAYVFDLLSASPTVPITTLANPTPAAFDSFGYAVSISGSWVAIGAFDDDTRGMGAGSAYVYDLTTTTPGVSVATLNHGSPAMNDRFASSVVIRGTTVVAGAPFVDSIAADRGAAYVFSLRPALSATPAAPGLITVAWTPTNSPGFMLQTSDSLAPTHWINASSGATNPVTIPSSNGMRFFRLAQP